MTKPSPTVNPIFTLLLLSFVFSCAQVQTSSSNRQANTPTTNGDSLLNPKNDAVINPNNAAKNSIDSSLEKYIHLSKNELVRAAVNDKLSEIGLFDQILKTDTAVYYVYGIGHDVVDKGGINPGFITDQWVYVDTISRVLYEYNLSNDSIIRWSK